MDFLGDLTKLVSNPALILCGTAGSDEYEKAAIIKQAVKIDRGVMKDEKTVSFEVEKRVTVDFPHVEQQHTAVAYCSNYLMDFVFEGGFMDMESFEFGQICRYHHLTDFGCVRICSDTPTPLTSFFHLQERAKNTANPNILSVCNKKLETSWDDEKLQEKALQRLLRKLLNFEPLVRQCFELIDLFTQHNILPEEYKDSLPDTIHRAVNSKLAHIYLFKKDVLPDTVPKVKQLDSILGQIDEDQKAEGLKYKKGEYEEPKKIPKTV